MLEAGLLVARCSMLEIWPRSIMKALCCAATASGLHKIYEYMVCVDLII